MPNIHDAKVALQALIAKYFAIDEARRAELTESDVVHQFITPLLGDVLGWPVTNPARYELEKRVTVGRKRPDITLTLESGERIFVEAKRFGMIGELAEARTAQTTALRPTQLSLPGMATDRTPEEQQAINYAFEERETWAILTNFERLRLFNARRDWLVFSFETPDAYTADFDLLWELAHPNILKGSLDRLSNQRHTRDVDVEYLALITEWRQRLADDILAHRAANAWAFLPEGGVNLPLLRAVVQRFLDRLVIVRFAEDHFVIPAGTLRQFYDLRRQNPYTQTMDAYLDHLFRRFDEAHNSALFAPGTVDQAVFSDDALLPLIAKLYDARYRAMPPDIIGNTYEQYLGQTLALDNGSVTTRDNVETRKKQGSYYTPHVIVQYIVAHGLGRYLYGTANGQPNGDPIEGETHKTSRDIRDLRVLDSACGSGSFLIEAYQVLARFYEGEIRRLREEMAARAEELAAEGLSPIERRAELAGYTVEIERLEDYPRLILETHLYGVDLDPQAAEIAVVNLMMRAMERRGRDKRLPLILNQNVKVGNSLIGLRPDDARMAEHADALAEIRHLRHALITTPHGPQHDQIIVDLHDATETLNAALDADFAPHFTDLDRAHPFHWGVEFPEVFCDADGQPLDNPGFTVIIGNPPWEIVKPDLREFYAQFDADIESKLKRGQVEQRIEELNADDPRRTAEWERVKIVIEETAAFVRASDDYTHQGRGDTATHKLFVERSYDLLQDLGRLGYVVPSGIYTDLGTKDLRLMLLDEGHIQYIFSFSNERFFFPGVHHSFKFVLLGAQKGPQSDGFWAAFRFNPRVAVAPDDLPAFLADEGNLVYVRRRSLERFSPDSLSLMEFEERQSYEVTAQIYGDWPLMGAQPHPKSLSAGGEGLDAPPADSPSLLAERGLGGEVAHAEREPGGEVAHAEREPGGEVARAERESGGEVAHAEREPGGEVAHAEREPGGEVVVGWAASDRWFTKSPLWNKVKPLARQHRKDPTPAEDALWQRLRNRQVNTLKFRRQHSIERFIVDFYCAELRLIVEVDGPIHDYTPIEDAIRQEFLESQGFRVLRFTNDEVLDEVEAVLARIAAQPHPKSLSAGGEGLDAAPLDSPSLLAERGLGGEVAHAQREPGGEEIPGTWSIKLNNEFHFTNDRHRLNTVGRGLPFYEGKMIHQYDAFYGEPQFWISEDKLADQSDEKRAQLASYRVAHRRIARSTDERTLIAAIVPPYTACENNATVALITGDAPETVKLYVCGLFNALVLDYVIRYKIATTLNMFYMYQLPLPRLTPGEAHFDAIVERAAQLTCTRAEYADLWAEVMGSAWDESCGVTDPAERQRLRDEIDAIVAHLYGLTRSEFDHILGTFPLVFPDDEAGQRRRAALLDTFDTWSAQLPSPPAPNS